MSKALTANELRGLSREQLNAKVVASVSSMSPRSRRSEHV